MDVNSTIEGSSSSQPTFGPEYWTSRRAQWLTAPSVAEGENARPVRGENQHRLIELMNEPGAQESDEVWSSGLDKVWKNLVNGTKLKKPLPLSTAIKILRSGWLRDGTWPEDATAPSSSEEDALAPPKLTTTHVFASPSPGERSDSRAGSASEMLARWK